MTSTRPLPPVARRRRSFAGLPAMALTPLMAGCGSAAGYAAAPAIYDASVFTNTPITVDRLAA